MLLNDVSSKGLVDSHLWTSCNNTTKNNLHYDFRIKCSVRLYLQLFVGEHMSYWAYLCLFAYSGVQHILCWVFVCFVFVLCTLCCQFLWIVHFGLPHWYSITFIYIRFIMVFLWRGLRSIFCMLNAIFNTILQQCESFLKAEYIRKTNTISRCTSIKN